MPRIARLLSLGAALGLVAPVSAGAQAPAAVAKGDAPVPNVHIVLKFVKARPQMGAVAVLDGNTCPACIVSNDPDFARDNSRETLIDLRLPRERQLDLAFIANRGSVTRVVLESDDLPARWEGGRLHVEVPPLSDDRIHAGEFATHIVERGMVLRFEHADPARLAGDYAAKPLPAIERRAVDNLEFALREAIRQLGLGIYVEQQGLGVIEVMGFDTNNPHGHRDSPPHFHMHLRWPYNTGTQIGHFYVGSDGLIRNNVAGITAYGLPQRTFERGAHFTTIGNQGKPVFTQTITAEGAFDLTMAAPDRPERTCHIRPGGAGFHMGAVIACDDHNPVRIQVIDDLNDGVLRVTTGSIVETFRFDRDTGRLLSPADVPPVPADAVIPVSRTAFPLSDPTSNGRLEEER